MLGVLGLVLEVVGLLGPGLVLGVLGLVLEVGGLLGPGVILGDLGLGLDEVGLFGPGLVCVLLVLRPTPPASPPSYSYRHHSPSPLCLPLGLLFSRCPCLKTKMAILLLTMGLLTMSLCRSSFRCWE